MQVDQEEPHTEEQQQQPQTPAENKAESEEMEVQP